MIASSQGLQLLALGLLPTGYPLFPSLSLFVNRYFSPLHLYIYINTCRKQYFDKKLNLQTILVLLIGYNRTKWNQPNWTFHKDVP